MVETPEGAWGLDKLGLYLEHLLPFQKNPDAAEFVANRLGVPHPAGLEMAANGVNESFVIKLQCGNCQQEWLDAVRYQNKTAVRCPKCKRINGIDTTNIHRITTASYPLFGKFIASLPSDERSAAASAMSSISLANEILALYASDEAFSAAIKFAESMPKLFYPIASRFKSTGGALYVRCGFRDAAEYRSVVSTLRRGCDCISTRHDEGDQLGGEDSPNVGPPIPTAPLPTPARATPATALQPTKSNPSPVPSESEIMVHLGDGWEMSGNAVVAAMKRSLPHSLAYSGPIDENGLVDPWNTARAVSSLGLNCPTIATRTDYTRGSKSVSASHSWNLCAAELVLANEVANWSDFLGADVKYAISLLPKAQHILLVWVWFSTLPRADNCFIFALDTSGPDQLAWLHFLWRSMRLAIRNGPKASGITNVCVNFEQGGVLDFLGEKIGNAS
jgi:phage FluMu protein Com